MLPFVVLFNRPKPNKPERKGAFFTTMIITLFTKKQKYIFNHKYRSPPAS